MAYEVFVLPASLCYNTDYTGGSAARVVVPRQPREHTAAV